MIADDQLSVLATLEYVLAGSYHVVMAENGARALVLATEQPVDGALIDLHMPGLNGIETCRRLRALGAETGRAWPIWVMSATVSGEARRSASDAGACGFIPKPFPSDLLDQLAVVLAPAKPAPDSVS